jgi:hypothetical protein
MTLRVPLNIRGNKVTPGGVPVFGESGGAAQALGKSRAALSQLKLQLKTANLNYRKSPSAINLKKIEAMKAQTRGLSKIVKNQAKGAAAEAKNKLKVLRRKIKDTRSVLRTLPDTAKGKRPIQIRLDRLINKVFSIRITRMTNTLNKNRSNAAAIRRSRLRTRSQLKALSAKIKSLTVPNPVLKMQRLKMITRLKKINLHLKKSLIRKKKIVKALNKLKAKKNIYNSRRVLQKAAAGAMGSIPQALNNIRNILKRHEKILRSLGGRRRKTRRPKRKCGNMKLARRRLKKVIRMIVKLKKTRASPARDKRLAKLRTLAKKRKVALRRIIKCKGVNTCGNLKKAKRNLVKAKRNLAKANKKAKERPSDEGAQRARKKFRARIKVHRKMIQKIWRCICRQAVKRYRKYKKLYAKKKSPVYRRKMNIHKKMIKRCNCRKARINFKRARIMHKKSRIQYMQNAKNTKAKDNIAVFYKRMIVHRMKLKSLGCKKLPVMPAPPSGLVKKKFILKKR